MAQKPTLEIRYLLGLGLPLIGSQVAQIAIGITDTLMIGWYDVPSLAAMTLGGSLFYLFFILASGFSWAAMPLIATAAELDDTVRLRRVTRMAMWLSTGFGLATIPIMWFSGPVFVALGQDPEVADLAQRYLRIAAWSIVPHMVAMALRSHLSGLERTGIILAVTIGAVVVNIGLNYLLIFGHFGAPELGIRGAAIASVGVAMAMAAGLIAFELRHFPDHALFQRLWRPDVDVLKDLFRLGWPVSLTHVSETALFAIAAVLIGWIGVLELAAHAIVLQLASITFMVHLGLSQAVTVRVGRAYGRQDFEAIGHRGKIAAWVSLAFAAVTILVFLSIPGVLVGGFIRFDEPNRAEILAIGIGMISMAALFQTVDAAQVMGLGVLRGMQDTRWPMVFATIGYWVIGIPSSYVLGFPLGLGANGVWLGLAVGLGAVAVALLVRLRILLRKRPV